MIASQIIERAKAVLVDAGIRWPDAELLNWLSDAQREIVLQRPDAYVLTEEITLQAGTLQKLPSYACSLIDIIRNQNYGIVRWIDRKALDQQAMNWHSDAPSESIVHYMIDPRDPLHFYVYPPAIEGSRVLASLSAAPDDINDVTDPISLSSIYANAMLDYVLYRAFSKDADFAANQNRAMQHFNGFSNSLGLKMKMDLMMTPNASSPNSAQKGG